VEREKKRRAGYQTKFATLFDSNAAIPTPSTVAIETKNVDADKDVRLSLCCHQRGSVQLNLGLPSVVEKDAIADVKL